MLIFIWFLQHIWALGFPWTSLEGLFKRWFWWPAWMQTTFLCFKIRFTLFIIKHRKVIWTHAGHQNRLLKSPSWPRGTEPMATIYCKKHLKCNMFYFRKTGKISSYKNLKKQVIKCWFGPMQATKITLPSDLLMLVFACISRGLRRQNPVKTNTKSIVNVAEFSDFMLKICYWVKPF